MGTAVNKTKILSSLFWKLLERGGAQGIQFVVQIMLAAFGIYAIAWVSL